MKSMSDHTSTGIAALRGRLAARHPKFAAADSFEQDIENACTRLRSSLKAARKKLAIDQSVLAERMQVGQPMISRIETGTGDIGLKTLYRYAKALGLTLAVDLQAKAPEDVHAPTLEPAAAIAVEEALESVDKAREALVAASEHLAAAA